MKTFFKIILGVFATVLVVGAFLFGGIVFFSKSKRVAEQNQVSPPVIPAPSVIPVDMGIQPKKDDTAEEKESQPPPTPPQPTEKPVQIPIPLPPSTKEPAPVEDDGILFDVPFTAQAPFGNWSDDRQQDGCEEASALMAIRWAQGLSLTLKEAEQEIIAISEFERAEYGGYHDTSTRDTAKRIIQGYFKYNNIEVKNTITTRDIIAALKEGNLVIVPVNGRKMGNPYYTPPGPIEHNLVIIGYDEKADEFIVNDPGTRRGKGFRYATSVLEDALQDYPTGYKEPITTIEKNMIVIMRDE